MVCAPYCSVDGSGLLIHPLVNSFHDLHAVLHKKWQRIAHSCARQQLSRQFAHRFLQRMAVHCSFFRSSTAFTVWYQIAKRMAADSSFFPSSTAFTVRALFSSPDDSALLILLFADGFHGLRSVFPNRWQRIARSSARQQLSRRFACRLAPRMVADCSYFRSSKGFTTVYTPYFCAHDVWRLLIFPLVYGFHGLHAVLHSECLRIAHSFNRQWLFRLLAHQFPQQVVVHCWFFRSSTAFTVCALLSSAHHSALLVLPLVNSFHGLRTVLLSG